MIKDVKILTSHDKSAVEKFIIEWSNKWYYMTKFLTNVVYNSFNYNNDNRIEYTIVMERYPDALMNLNDDLYTNGISNVTKLSEQGWVSTTVEQVHSEEWGRGKKGKDTKEEMSTTSDSSSIYEG